LYFEITDGIGIPEDKLATVLIAFQGSIEVNRKYGGTDWV
jgi:hypothetical protein